MPDPHYVPRRGPFAFLRRSVGTFFGLWLMLIVMFLVIWQVLGTGASAPAEASADGGAFWSQTLRDFIPIPIVICFVLLVLAGLRGFQRSHAAALKSQADGDRRLPPRGRAHLSWEPRWSHRPASRCRRTSRAIASRLRRATCGPIGSRVCAAQRPRGGGTLARRGRHPSQVVARAGRGSGDVSSRRGHSRGTRGTVRRGHSPFRRVVLFERREPEHLGKSLAALKVRGARGDRPLVGCRILWGHLRRGILAQRPRWLPSQLIPHRHRPRAELQPAHELQDDTLR